MLHRGRDVLYLIIHNFYFPVVIQWYLKLPYRQLAIWFRRLLIFQLAIVNHWRRTGKGLSVVSANKHHSGQVVGIHRTWSFGLCLSCIPWYFAPEEFHDYWRHSYFFNVSLSCTSERPYLNICSLVRFFYLRKLRFRKLCRSTVSIYKFWLKWLNWSSTF